MSVRRWRPSGAGRWEWTKNLNALLGRRNADRQGEAIIAAALAPSDATQLVGPGRMRRQSSAFIVHEDPML